MNTDLQKAIADCAKRIETFQIDGLKIGFDDARKRIKLWISNFRGFKVHEKILINVLNNIKFLSDDDILHQCLEFQKKHFGLDGYDIYFTCLGAETESSSRIMRQLNSHPKYAPNISDLLKIIQERQVKKPAIVFVDDFLNSGGQFNSILKSWKGSSSITSYESKLFNQRNMVSKSDYQLLEKCELHFFYLYGMARGLEQAKKIIKEMGFEGDTHVLNVYSDEIGLFGDMNDKDHIKNYPSCEISSKSIFYGMTCDQIGRFYELSGKAGTALLKFNKPLWGEEKCQNHKFGYGNSGQLFISQTNIPTCTLTCLWQSGSIEINGKKVNWKPLIPRIEKKIGGTESLDKDSSKKTKGIDKSSKDTVNDVSLIESDSNKILIKYLEKIVRSYEYQASLFINMDCEIQISNDLFDDNIDDDNIDVLSDCLTTVKENQHIVFLGNAGSGKTTLLQYIAWHYANKTISKVDSPSTIFPVFTKMSFCSPTEIQKYIENKLGTPLENVESMALLLFDGLNEVTQKTVKDFVRGIQNLIDQFPKAKVVITTRPSLYNGQFDEAKTFRILPFNNAQKAQFLKKNFSGKVPKLLIKNLSKDKKVEEWTNNPLILNMFVKLQRKDYSPPPQFLGELFELFVGKLIKLDSTNVNIRTNDIKRKKLLSYLAYNMRKAGETTIHIDDCYQILKEGIDKEGFKVDLADFIVEIVDSHLMINDEDDKISFNHETYQDFFTAKEILSRTKEIPLFWEELVYNSFFEEALIMFYGIMSAPQNFIKKIASINPLLAARCLNSSTKTHSELRNVVVKNALNKTSQYDGDSKQISNALVALMELNEFDICKDAFIELIKMIEKSHNLISKIYQKSTHQQILFIAKIILEYSHTDIRKLSLLAHQYFDSLPGEDYIEFLLKSRDRDMIGTGINLIKKRKLNNEFPDEKIFKILLDQPSIPPFERAFNIWKKKQNLRKIFPATTIIDKALRPPLCHSPSILNIGRKLVKEYGLHDKYPLDKTNNFVQKIK